MTTIQLNKKFYSIPTHWDELQPDQLLQVMQVLYLKEYKAEQMLLRLLQVLTRLSNATFFKIDVTEAEEYFYLLVFLFKEDLEFTKNLLPLYHHTSATGGQKTFYGPADGCRNMRMSEFHFAERHLIAWFDSERKDEAALNNLVATLYRPMPEGYDHVRNPEGDLREPYNQNISAYNAHHSAAHFPPSVKLAIATWYNGCRRQIIANNPDVFEGSGDPARYGLASVILSVAEGGVFGDFDKVEKEYVGTVMMYLNESIDKAKKLEKKS